MATRTPAVLQHDGDRPWIDAGYLHDAGDRADWRSAVRTAVELVRTEAFGALVEHWHGPSPEVVAVDRDLDAWIAAHLGTSHHLCATAPMGPDDDPDAVVDQMGRVRGVDGLAVADLSILPDAPSRGPSCTAVVLAEHLAATFEGNGGASGTVSPAP
jgi:choline dehydrogenase-like flavoprotein